jgi:hypothetical protein
MSPAECRNGPFLDGLQSQIESFACSYDGQIRCGLLRKLAKSKDKDTRSSLSIIYARARSNHQGTNTRFNQENMNRANRMQQSH